MAQRLLPRVDRGARPLAVPWALIVSRPLERGLRSACCWCRWPR
jgi:hypothetical protein